VAWNEPMFTLDESCDCGEEEIEGYTFLGANGLSQYYLYNVDSVEWAEAKLLAEAAGGHLVTISSESENEWLQENIASQGLVEGAWMGLNDLETESVNEWVTGEPLTYENFHAGMADDTDLEDVYLFRNSGEWEDKPTGIPYFFIMEMDCASISQENEVNAANGGFFPIGTTTVSYTLTDNCGNAATCSFDIIVNPDSMQAIADPCQIIGEEGLHIESFRTADIQNDSGDDNGYADYSDVTMKLGEGIEVEMIPGGEYANEAVHWSVWLDSNDDGDFYDAELLYSAVAQGAHIAAIELPLDAQLSQGTHAMRVGLSRDAGLAPCGDFGAGEVEDYSVEISTESITVDCQLEFKHFVGAKQNVDNQLDWMVQSDCKVSYYGVHHSLNGIDFEEIKKIGATLTPGVASTESWLHENLDAPVNYYKISAVTVDDEAFFSNIIELIDDTTLGQVNIYPNPSAGQVNIDLVDYAGASAQVVIYNMLGQELWSKSYASVPSKAIQLDLAALVDQTLLVTIKLESQDIITLPLMLNKTSKVGGVKY